MAGSEVNRCKRSKSAVLDGTARLFGPKVSNCQIRIAWSGIMKRAKSVGLLIHVLTKLRIHGNQSHPGQIAVEVQLGTREYQS